MIEKNRDILDKPEEEDKERDYWKLGRFYYNPADKSVFVPKRWGRGWTINFGNPIGVILYIAIIAAVIIAIVYSKAKGY
jgi:uncharacterized membrane protein